MPAIVRGRAGARFGPVRFGTSGFRGVLGDAFTFERAAALVQCIAEASDAPKGSRFVVAYDTRFLGRSFAEDAAEILAGAGYHPVVGQGPTPTPAACHAVRRLHAHLGLIFTASHNAPEYQGLKLIGPDGGSASRRLTDRLEARVAKRLDKPRPQARKSVRGRIDLVGPYLKGLSQRVEPRRWPRAMGPVIFDAMHGTGAGVVDRWLKAHRVPVQCLRQDPDPTFGGSSPDPTSSSLLGLRTAVLRDRARFGVATDGDGDRFSVLDERGERLSETEAVALLVDHLARQGRIQRGVALSVATGSLPEAVARAHGLPVVRVGLGFKALTEQLLAGKADVAGEESGGFAWSPFVRDKDGTLAVALLAERMALDPRPLSEQVRGLHRAHGHSVCGRISVPVTPEGRVALAKLSSRSPRQVLGTEVDAVQREEGLRLRLADGGFLMWRASGTEPLLRIYAEAPNPSALRRRLAWGRKQLAPPRPR